LSPGAGRRGPLRRIQAGAGSAGDVTVARRASHEVRCSSEFCYARGRQSLLVLCPRLVLAVSDGTGGSYRAPSPAPLRKRVHPLVSFAPLQSPPVSCPPAAFGRRRLPWGCALPLRDFSPRRRCMGIPLPTPSHLQRFSRSWRHRHRPCGSISPRCHVQGSPFRVCPLAQPSRLVDGSVPSCRLAPRRCEQLPTRSTMEGPAFRALFCARVRDPDYGDWPPP